MPDTLPLAGRRASALFAPAPQRQHAHDVRFLGLVDELPGDRHPVLASELGPGALASFHHALVRSHEGDPVGRVCAVENFGATDIVEIEKPDGKKFMVPLTRQAVPSWDERTLTIAEGFWDR